MKWPGFLARKTQRFAVVAWKYNNVASYMYCSINKPLIPYQ